MSQLKERIDKLRSVKPDNRYIEAAYKKVEKDRDELKAQAMKNIINTAKIHEHYRHAIEKHPYFCDGLTAIDLDTPRTMALRYVERELEYHRHVYTDRKRNNEVYWRNVLNCEVWEINEAIVKRDINGAIEECYDAIAVILRVIDVLEGRQPLGDPEKGETK